MASFAHHSPIEVIEFIDLNFDLFSGARASNFPDNVLDGIAHGDFAVIVSEEGFAVAYKGRRFKGGPGGIEPDLMFLFIDPAYEGRGFGTKLIEQVKAEVTPGLPVILKCEGERRKAFFERRGFHVVEYFDEIDTYLMKLIPMLSAG